MSQATEDEASPEDVAARQAEFRVESICHAKQASMVNSLVIGPRRYVCVLAGRQSGKSYGAVMAALMMARSRDGVNVIYVTSTYQRAKIMAFLPAIFMCRSYALLDADRQINKTEQSISFPNGSVVYFLGADKEDTIGKLRGTPNLLAVIIDESGVYASDTLRTMIETVTPGLRPLAGKLILLGTPSLLGKQGTFYEATTNDVYEQHRFTYRDNDKVGSYEDAERIIDEDLRALRLDRTSAYYLREYECEFVVELAEKVYQLGDDNLIDELPSGLTTFVIGGDLGVSANDAFIALGWRAGDVNVYVAEEKEISGQDSVAYAKMTYDIYQRRQPITIAVDPGGLGQKTIMTVQAMFPSIPIVEAIKPALPIQVRAVNSLLQDGRLKVPRNSKLAAELARPTWKGGIVGADIEENGKHSDLVPSLRYACIAARPFLPEPPPTPIETETAIDAMIREQIQAQATGKAPWAEGSSFPAPDDGFNPFSN